MLISGETDRYELTRLNLHCLQKTSILPVALKELRYTPEDQIRRSVLVLLPKISLLLANQSLCFGYSHESSHSDNSFEFPQHKVWKTNKDFITWKMTLFWSSGYCFVFLSNHSSRVGHYSKTIVSVIWSVFFYP